MNRDPGFTYQRSQRSDWPPRTGGCGCGPEGIAEAWTEMEAYPDGAEWFPPDPPAFLADQAEWVDVYQAGGTYQDGVRMLLGPEAEALTDAEVDVLLDSITAGMAYGDAEDFFRSIGRAVQSALPALGRVAQSVLPVAGAALGTFLGPGVGTAVGGALGSAAGKLVGQATRSAGPGRRGQTPRRVRQHGAGASSAGGQATQQLLSLLNNPQLLSAVANAALGGRGLASATPTQGTPAFGQLMGSLAQLAHEAAGEVASETWHDPHESVADSTGVLAHRLAEAVRAEGRV